MTDEFPAWKPDEIPSEGVGFDAPDVDWANMDPTDLGRMFDILDTAVNGTVGLDGEGFDRLLSVFERTFLGDAALESEEVERMLSVLEEAIIDPTNPDHAEEVVAVLDASLDGTVGDTAMTDGALSVMEAALADPSRSGSVVEDVIGMFDTGLTDPRAVESAADSVLSMLDVTESGSTGGTAEEMDSWLDELGVGVSVSGDADGDDDVNSFLDAVDTEFSDTNAAAEMSDRFRIARIVTAATQRSTEYSVRSGVRTGTRMAQAAMTAESPADMLDKSRSIVFGELDELGFEPPEGIADTDGDGDGQSGGRRGRMTLERLQERGERLMDEAAKVDREDPGFHPAFPRILDSISPDEGRILRLLATEGPQPSVDIRDVGYVPITSKLVAAGLTMISEEAGCRYESRVTAYLNNLQRLGLIWFSDEPVEDLKRYQVIEAQPDVDQAIEEARRAKMIRRSIHLTPFGFDFCRVCLPVDVEAEDAAGVYDVPDESTSDGMDAIDGPASEGRLDNGTEFHGGNG